MINWYRILPYFTLGGITIIIFILSLVIENIQVKSILLNIFSNSLFFFIVYLFYDNIKRILRVKERKYLDEYIKNKISNDIFVTLYYFKKIIHGYNLETNRLKTIFSIINYSKLEIENSVKNQNYLGFQIFKINEEVRSLFSHALNDNLILKYSTHNESINILRINNNLTKLEALLKMENAYSKSAEKGIEFEVVNGKEINPQNDDKYLLMKKTVHNNRFIVYDSGFFEYEKKELLLNRYVLKEKNSKEISNLLFETFSLMKYWIPESTFLVRNESRFKIIKDFFNPNTNSKTIKSNIFVSDIVEVKKLG